MCDVMIRPSRSVGALLFLTVCLVPFLPGCGPSGRYPKAPKLLVKGPAGSSFGYSVTYFDGKDSVDLTATAKVIPDSGVYSEDLKSGHQGLLIEVIPSGASAVTVILLDGTKEIQRETARGQKQRARLEAGKVPASALPGAPR
jgi:hypothetical protein